MMAKCRICGVVFRPNANTGKEICGNDGCWVKAWNETIARLRGEKPEETAARVNRRVSEEERQYIIKLHSQGVRRGEIEKITGIPYANLGKIIQRYEDEMAEIAEMRCVE